MFTFLFMNLIKNCLFCLYLLLFCFQTFSQDRNIAPRSDSATARLARQLAHFPHEKIYVQTDKPNYLSGERIWLRAHLVDAMNNKSSFFSRYVYTELFNPFNELIRRIKDASSVNES